MLTEVVFILDESGSMYPLKDDTIGGFNSMLEKQRKIDGEVYVSTVLFSDRSKVIYDRIGIKEISDMKNGDYEPSGCTALLDALGDAIKHISTIHKYARKEDVPDNTLFIIITDGMENASHRYNDKDVKKMIEEKKKKGWEFIFLAANIDAIETASTYGINKDMAAQYVNDSDGVTANFDALSDAIASVRTCSVTGKEWKKKIRK